MKGSVWVIQYHNLLWDRDLRELPCENWPAARHASIMIHACGRWSRFKPMHTPAQKKILSLLFYFILFVFLPLGNELRLKAVKDRKKDAGLLEGNALSLQWVQKWVLLQSEWSTDQCQWRPEQEQEEGGCCWVWLGWTWCCSSPL